MKRSSNLNIIFLAIFTLSLISLFFVASIQASQVNVLNPKIDIEATAQAIQLQNRLGEVETAGKERLLDVQAQITQTRQTLDEFNRTAQTQAPQLEFQLSNLQAQVEQTQADNQSSQKKIIQLQQSIQEDEANYQTELAKLAAQRKQVQQELATANSQLQAAYNELANRQTQTPILSVGESNLTGGSDDNQGDASGNDHSDDVHNDDNRDYDDD